MHTFPLKGFNSIYGPFFGITYSLFCVMALPCMAHSNQKMAKIRNFMKFPKI
jgi:hypothetical protein